jgi:rod shape-determining protein MreC|tara:strand:+ start:3166 stop:3957 length:792 start_codon:yes stop_codon:yes gene_type:complete
MRNFFKHPFVWSLLIIFVLILLNSQGWLRDFKDIFFQTTGPVQKNLYQFSLKANSFTDFLFSIKELKQENTNLKQTNQELLNQLSQLREASRENEFLREQLGLFEPEQRELILAQIISQGSSNSARYFLIDQGIKHGVKQKAIVITAGNLLVGQVTEISDSFSMVQLIIDPNSRVNALIQETTVNGLIKGGPGSELIFDLLPQDQLVKKGETVVTSGLAGVFPPGLLIGQISKIISSQVQISQVARVKPVVDFETLDKVFIIK